jgi:hypothetical protein
MDGALSPGNNSSNNSGQQQSSVLVPTLDFPAALLSSSERDRVLRRLKHELVRKRTFDNWPSSVVQPADLARAGFFYYGEGERPIFWCSVKKLHECIFPISARLWRKVVALTTLQIHTNVCRKRSELGRAVNI